MRSGRRHWVCGFAGLRVLRVLRVLLFCGLRIAFKGVAFLISILTDINYYQIVIKGLIMIIIKGVWGDKYNNN